MFGLFSRTAHARIADLKARKAAGESITAKEYAEAGFSLVELIVVVAIIGILVIVAIPTFGLVQSNAKEKAVKNAAADLTTSIAIALTDEDLATTATSAALIAKKKLQKNAAEVAVYLPSYNIGYNNTADDVSVRVVINGKAAIGGTTPVDPQGLSGIWTEVETGEQSGS